MSPNVRSSSGGREAPAREGISAEGVFEEQKGIIKGETLSSSSSSSSSSSVLLPPSQKRSREGRSAAAAAAGGGGGGTAYLSPIAHPLLEGKLLRRCLKLIHIAADREKANRSSCSSHHNSSSSSSMNRLVGTSSSKEAAAAATRQGQQQQQQQKHQQPTGCIEDTGREGSKGNSQKNTTSSSKSSRPWKLLRRGVHEVTKCLRRDMRGIVFFASDVFPIDIIAHLPILCEEKDIVYAYLCSKRTLGHAFRSQRPASVIMITPDPTITTMTAAGAAGAAPSPVVKKKKKQKRDTAAAAATQRTAEAGENNNDDDDEEEEEEEDAAAGPGGGTAAAADEDNGDSFEQLFKKVQKSVRKIHPYF